MLALAVNIDIIHGRVNAKLLNDMVKTGSHWKYKQMHCYSVIM